ncbi:MAG: sigma-70 family RNA polymerase sigma factor [Phycisphaerales bacterium]|nr:MAG: sigma-70 family RNA polymerase sigma factor [Phycisphaerales bacterium]
MGQITPTMTDDRELLAAIQTRDREALDALYERYSGLVYAVCLRVLQCPADAEDALIDTFWQVWSKPEKYDATRGTVPTYLAMIARSRALDMRRSRSAESNRRDQAKPVDGLAPEMKGEMTIDPAVMQEEENDQVHGALASLTPEQREAIRMSFYNGLSHQEIAQALRTPVGTIKSRLRQGLIQLREYFRTSGEEPLS